MSTSHSLHPQLSDLSKSSESVYMLCLVSSVFSSNCGHFPVPGCRCHFCMSIENSTEMSRRTPYPISMNMTFAFWDLIQQSVCVIRLDHRKRLQIGEVKFKEPTLDQWAVKVGSLIAECTRKAQSNRYMRVELRLLKLRLLKLRLWKPFSIPV